MTRANPAQTATTLIALGPVNLLRVGGYRLGLRFGRHPVQRLRSESLEGPFFSAAKSAASSLVARSDWRDRGQAFGWKTFALDVVPAWHGNPFRPGVRAASDRPWWTLPDFDPAVGDIKAVWEASRFDWLIPMAQRAALGDAAELGRLNAWLGDWSRANPPYLGANWKCGQEASIRVMHVAVAALMLGQVEEPAPGLLALIRLHLRRIAPTVGYAIGQQNNHGTSEAAALFIGGSWLARRGDAEGERWSHTGLRWLEDRAQILIAPDGTFSQYSVNYHRLMLTTYSLAEVWRRRLGLADFSSRLTTRLGAATSWLHQFTDPGSGDVPVIGANDGTHLMRLTDEGYRDHRPAVQLAAALFLNRAAYGQDHAGTLAWLGVACPKRPLEPVAGRTFDDGGFHVLRRGDAVAYLHYPRFRFRPSQADILHLDLWADGCNLLRDGGTYSYNVSEADTAYFNGVESHNTVQADGRDQMPRVGRFLFAGWPRTHAVEPVCNGEGFAQASAAYRDAWGVLHCRRVVLNDDRVLTCQDRITGLKRGCVLRWRLQPGDWRLEDGVAAHGTMRVAVSADVPLTRLEIVKGAESRFYLEKTPLPVLEVEVAGARAQFTTRISF